MLYDKMGKLVKAFAMIVGGILLIPAAIAFYSILNGFTLSLLWNWLIVPTFHFMPTLSVVQAIGVATVVHFMTSRYTANGPKISRSQLAVYTLTFYPAIILFGYIIHCYM